MQHNGLVLLTQVSSRHEQRQKSGSNHMQQTARKSNRAGKLEHVEIYLQYLQQRGRYNIISRLLERMIWTGC